MITMAAPGNEYAWPDAPNSVTRDFERLERDWDAVLAQFGDQPDSRNTENRNAQISAHEWLQQNPETSEFVRLLEQASSVRKGLRGDLPNCTVWAPTNDALKDLQCDDDSELEKLLQHHVAPHDMPLARLLETADIPTLAHPSTLNGPLAQRRRVGDSYIAIHGRSKMVRMNTHGIQVSNGTVYLIDGVLPLPPPVSQLGSMLPETQFSHLRHFLAQTNFAEELSSAFHLGGTFFAPVDEAFEALGPDVLDFLQSSKGVSYLKKLLRYHASPGETLFSSMFYHGENRDGVTSPPIKREPPAETSKPQPPTAADQSSAKVSSATTSRPQPPAAATGGKPRVIKGRREFPLPTLLKDQWCQAEIVRVGGVISMSVQGDSGDVVTQDVMTLNGVVHAVNRVLLPQLKDPDEATETGDVERLKMALDQKE